MLSVVKDLNEYRKGRQSYHFVTKVYPSVSTQRIACAYITVSNQDLSKMLEYIFHVEDMTDENPKIIGLTVEADCDVSLVEEDFFNHQLQDYKEQLVHSRYIKAKEGSFKRAPLIKVHAVYMQHSVLFEVYHQDGSTFATAPIPVYELARLTNS